MTTLEIIHDTVRLALFVRIRNSAEHDLCRMQCFMRRKTTTHLHMPVIGRDYRPNPGDEAGEAMYESPGWAESNGLLA